MTSRVSPAVFGLVAIAAAIQLVPLIAALDPSRLADLYGVAPRDATTELLLRHRAVLLGLVGALLVAGLAWRPLLGGALVVGLTSKLSFLMMFVSAPALNAELTRVARADALSATLLVVAAAVMMRAPRTHTTGR